MAFQKPATSDTHTLGAIFVTTKLTTMIDKIRKYFSDRKESRKLEREKFYADTLALGFDKIEFPIIIQDGHDLSIVGDREHFFGDADIYFYEFDSSMRLIDVNGRQFTWGYSTGQRSNYPDRFIKQMTVDELREIANQYFKDSKQKPDIGDEQTTKELIDKIWDYL